MQGGEISARANRNCCVGRALPKAPMLIESKFFGNKRMS